MSIRLGYAGICLSLKDEGVTTNRGAIMRTIEKNGVAYVKSLIRKNIADLRRIILWNESVGIRFFRMSSDMFPHATDPRVRYSIDFIRTELAEIGALARALGHRLTFHPSQYCQLGSPNKGVLKQTIRDLAFHARVFRYMGLRPEHGSVMILHGGGAYGDKAATLRRWSDNFAKLDPDVRQYISLENDDYIYTVADILPVCEKLNIPVCVDFFHHKCNGDDIFDLSALMNRVINTWHLRGIRPKCHWSNQAPGARRGSHADCVADISREIYEYYIAVDIMIESKTKDLCVLETYKKYFVRIDSNDGRVDYVRK